MEIIAQYGTIFLIMAMIFGLYMTWGIGANDVANAMGTSVGSGAITVMQAIVIAAVFEFTGAFIAGGPGVALAWGGGAVGALAAAQVAGGRVGERQGGGVQMVAALTVGLGGHAHEPDPESHEHDEPAGGHRH